MHSESSGTGTGSLVPPKGYSYYENSSDGLTLSGAIAGVMGFATRVLEHELVHFGAFANGSGPIPANDNVNLNIFGVPVSLERGSLYEAIAYGSIGNHTSTNAGYGIFNEYSRIRNRGGGTTGHDTDLQNRAADFKFRKRADY
jgi:hypothetical protein